MIKAVDFESIRQMVTNLKTTYVNKLVLSMEKTLNSWSELLAKTLDGTYRDLTIHKGPERLVQNPTNYRADKEFSALVDMNARKWNCLLCGTLGDLIQGAL